MQRGVSQQPAIDKQFFSQQNEVSLYNILAQDFQQRQGGLTDKQQNRLAKALEHYMQQVWDVNGPMPIPQLNREVLNATSTDFQSYLRRDAGAMPMATSQTIVTDPANQNRIETTGQRLAYQQGLPVQPRPTFESNLLMDTGTRFEQLQQDRTGGSRQPTKPQIPDFSITLTANGDEPSAISLFESARKAREAEAARVKPIGDGKSETDANPLVRFMTPPSVINDPQANPTLAQPIAMPAPRGPLPQDFIIKQDDVITYKETEYNLILYSADRDWLNNSSQTRYQFSVNFDPGNTKQGFYSQLTTNKKFKNISRIELVKAILPTEGLENLTQQSGGNAINLAKINALSFPYVLLRIPELDVNNYGSDDNLNNSFAMLQYDANWYTDTTNLEDGYLAMIPKFMKCQKIYQPTPLATLQKLTIELNRPDGQPLSSVVDTLSIQNIYFSANNVLYPYPTANIQIPGYYNIADANGCGDYILIQTSTYFSKWQFAEGNRIQIQGLVASQVPGGNTLAAQNLIDYLENPNGIPIVDIGTTGGTPVLGANAVGYANVILVRAPHVDPTTGSILVQPFGGSTGAMDTLATAANAVLTTATTYTGAKLINLSHQTSVVLRVITRELDPTARVRPDNL